MPTADLPGPADGGVPGASGLPDGPAARVRALRVDTDPIAAAGVIGWVVCLLATLVIPALREGDRWWWPWCALAGVVFGLLGWGYLRRGRGNVAALEQST